MKKLYAVKFRDTTADWHKSFEVWICADDYHNAVITGETYLSEKNYPSDWFVEKVSQIAIPATENCVDIFLPIH